MKIVMVTNTFRPHVGGVARSVDAFTQAYRQRGHRTLVIAPEFDGAPEEETDVVRLPAIQNFNGSDFSVRIPIPGYLSGLLHDFRPEVVHSHHPFLLGGTALRIAARWGVPLVLTHHTMYEHYTHYVPGDSPALQRFVVDLATGYANLCDQVVAPSQSIAEILKQRGVETPIEAVPTGVDVDRFRNGDGLRYRRNRGIPDDAFLIGHLGRLAPEKNLDFLCEAVAHYLQRNRSAYFVVAGRGSHAETMRRFFIERGLDDRLRMVGVVKGQEQVDAYHAMDVFAFASHSETQGMVLTEAMACGVPVVAIDASGVREVVRDEQNGRLMQREDVEEFVEALDWVGRLSTDQRRSVQNCALQTAEEFSMRRCTDRMLAIYEKLIGSQPGSKETRGSLWEATLRRWESEWELWSNRARAASSALHDEAAPPRLSLWRPLKSFWYRLQRWRRQE